MNNFYTIKNDELYHFGVKGMKWGIRRYQNKDGSLTNAGKKRLVKNIRNCLLKAIKRCRSSINLCI